MVVADAIEQATVVLLDDFREALDHPDRCAQVVRYQGAERRRILVRGGRQRAGGRQKRRATLMAGEAARLVEAHACLQSPALQRSAAGRSEPDLECVEIGFRLERLAQPRHRRRVEELPERLTVLAGVQCMIGRQRRGAQRGQAVLGVGAPQRAVDQAEQASHAGALVAQGSGVSPLALLPGQQAEQDGQCQQRADQQQTEVMPGRPPGGVNGSSRADGQQQRAESDARGFCGPGRCAPVVVVNRNHVIDCRSRIRERLPRRGFGVATARRHTTGRAVAPLRLAPGRATLADMRISSIRPVGRPGCKASASTQRVLASGAVR